MTEEKSSRRGYLQTVGASIVSLGVGAAVGYGVATALTPEKIVEVPVPAMIQTVQGATVAERAVNGAKELIEAKGIPKGTEIPWMAPSGLVAVVDLVAPEWEKLTGTKAVAISFPAGEVMDKAMLEAVSKTGTYCGYLMRPYMLGELVEADALVELDDWYKIYDPDPLGMPLGFAYPLFRQYAEYRGRLYSLPLDGDEWISYYRKDLLEDPKEQEAFEKEYGYPLKAPETMDEYRDTCEFFNRPPDLYGNNECRYMSDGFKNFYWRLANKKFPSLPIFDDDMHPTINSPEGIKAAEQFLEMVNYIDPAILGFAYGEHCAYFADGKAFAATSYPSFGKFASAEGAVTRGKVVFSHPPGEWVDSPAGKVLNRRTIQAGGWTVMISAYYEYPELAYLFAQFLTSPEWIIPCSISPGSWCDPIRYNQIGPLADPRQYTGHPKEEVDALWYAAMTAIPILCIRKALEYHRIVMETTHGAQSRVLAGEDITSVAREIVEHMDTELEKVTEREGRSEQIESWRWHKTTYPVGLV